MATRFVQRMRATRRFDGDVLVHRQLRFLVFQVLKHPTEISRRQKDSGDIDESIDLS